MDCHKIDWQVKRLKELCQFQNGYSFKNKDYQNQLNDGYVVFRMGNINRGGGLNRSASSVYVSRDLSTKLSRFVLDKNDIVMCMTDMKSSMNLLGHTALIDKSDYYILNQRVGRITVTREDILDYRYLFYYTNSKTYLEHLRSVAHSGVQVNLSTKAIQESPILLPPLPTQRKIAAVLSAYDDLIENNTRRIEILEEMASAIYREWFVEFRFPGHEGVEMVESELGLIPQGWEVKQLGEMCHVIMGLSPKSEFYNETGDGLPFHQGVTDFGERFPTDRVYCTIQKRIAEADDILFSVRAPVGRINIANKKVVIGRGLSAIRSKNGNQTFLLQQLKDRFQEEDTMGSGAIFNAIRKTDLLGIPLKTPTESVIGKFEEIVNLIFAELANLTLKNANLRQARNLLLPKLISGEIDVSELIIDAELKYGGK